jgi:hypothetical protein
MAASFGTASFVSSSSLDINSFYKALMISPFTCSLWECGSLSHSIMQFPYSESSF